MSVTSASSPDEMQYDMQMSPILDKTRFTYLLQSQVYMDGYTSYYYTSRASCHGDIEAMNMKTSDNKELHFSLLKHFLIGICNRHKGGGQFKKNWS